MARLKCPKQLAITQEALAKMLPPCSFSAVWVVDTETTGLTATDEIIEIGAVELKKCPVSLESPSDYATDRFSYDLTGRTFQSYIRPSKGTWINPKAAAVNKISFAKLRQAPAAAKVLASIRVLIGDDTAVVAHNADFDYRMISKGLEAAQLESIDYNRWYCTMQPLKACFPNAECNLHSACRTLGVDEAYDYESHLHSALVDAFVTSHLLMKLQVLTFDRTVVNPITSPKSRLAKSSEYFGSYDNRPLTDVRSTASRRMQMLLRSATKSYCHKTGDEKYIDDEMNQTPKRITTPDAHKVSIAALSPIATPRGYKSEEVLNIGTPVTPRMAFSISQRVLSPGVYSSSQVNKKEESDSISDVCSPLSNSSMSDTPRKLAMRDLITGVLVRKL